MEIYIHRTSGDIGAIYLSLSALMVVRQALILVGGCQSWFAGGKWANGQRLRIFTILPSPLETAYFIDVMMTEGDLRKKC